MDIKYESFGNVIAAYWDGHLAWTKTYTPHGINLGHNESHDPHNESLCGTCSNLGKLARNAGNPVTGQEAQEIRSQFAAGATRTQLRIQYNVSDRLLRHILNSTGRFAGGAK